MASRPFYQSVSPMTLGPIEERKYAEFVTGFFHRAGITLPDANIDIVYRMFSGCTWYMQSIFNEMYSRSRKGENLNTDAALSALNNVVISYEPIYRHIMSNLPERQKEVLVAIAKQGRVTEIASADFIRRHALQSASSVQSSIKQLLAKEIVVRKGNEYSIPDYFFAFWLMTTYGPGINITHWLA